MLIAATLVALAATIPATPAAAQSDSELRRENQRLRTEVEELTRELEKERQRIADLEAALAALQKQLAERGSGSGGASAPPVEEKVSIDESKPDASPRAMLNALKAAYEEAMSEMEIGQPASRERTLYTNQVERWLQQVTRDYRMTVEWTVTVSSINRHANGKDWLLEMQAVDPKFDTKLGDPFTAMLSDSRRRHLEKGIEGTWLVRGRMTPALRFNAQREEVGTFDSPRFVGPFVEFGFGLEVLSIVEAKPVETSDSGGG